MAGPLRVRPLVPLIAFAALAVACAPAAPAPTPTAAPAARTPSPVAPAGAVTGTPGAGTATVAGRTPSPAGTPGRAPSPAAAAGSPIPGVETFSDLSRQHVSGTVNYPQVPPVGGPHANAWQNCGIYTEPVPSEQGVHSLEHGAVWITYRPNLPEAEVRALRSLVEGARNRSHVLLSPWRAEPALPSPIVASAWGLQLKVDNAGDPRLGQFVDRYANGPQAPEPGAPCNRGVGTPASKP